MNQPKSTFFTWNDTEYDATKLSQEAKTLLTRYTHWQNKVAEADEESIRSRVALQALSDQITTTLEYENKVKPDTTTPPKTNNSKNKNKNKKKRNRRKNK